jgi:hypothetical protein
VHHRLQRVAFLESNYERLVVICVPAVYDAAEFRAVSVIERVMPELRPSSPRLVIRYCATPVFLRRIPPGGNCACRKRLTRGINPRRQTRPSQQNHPQANGSLERLRPTSRVRMQLCCPTRMLASLTMFNGWVCLAPKPIRHECLDAPSIRGDWIGQHYSRGPTTLTLWFVPVEEDSRGS